MTNQPNLLMQIMIFILSSLSTDIFAQESLRTIGLKDVLLRALEHNSETAGNPSKNSVSLHPFSLFSGVVGLNYERLLLKNHEIVAEGFIGKGKEYEALLNYRYHFKPSMDS